MNEFPPSLRTRYLALTFSALALVAACDRPLDYDLRGVSGGASTTAAASQVTTASRPVPDSRGVISYPNYQVAVARRDDTVQSVSARLGLDPSTVARFNGIEVDVPLRQGELIALPVRVAETAPAAGAVTGGPIAPGSVDIGTLAGGAINRSPGGSSGVSTSALPPAQGTTAATPAQPAAEPVRHKVVRGETAFTIARLYNVPVASLAEWNSLGPDFAIREGQYLLIPVAQQTAPVTTATVVPKPGVGSPTPTPPSSTKPLPPKNVPVPVAQTPAPPPVDVGKRTETSDNARMVYPVTGSIIREYAKGRNEGIDIKAAAGTAVKAADAGTVAAITKSADGVPIVVIRHDPELLTVYANVTDVTVAKGDQVSRGQAIAKLRGGKDAYVHFEVRKGFDSVDPIPFLK